MSGIIYDYVVVGAGLYGLRMARNISKKFNLAKILLIESSSLAKSINLSKNYYSVENGINCKVDSEIFETITSGNKSLKELCIENNLYNETKGEIIAANEEKDKKILKSFMDSQDIVKINKISNEAAHILDSSIKTNLNNFDFYHLEETFIVDFNQIKSFLFEEVRNNENIHIKFENELKQVKKSDDCLEIYIEDKSNLSQKISENMYKAKFLINTAGVKGLDIAHMCNCFWSYLSCSYREFYFYFVGNKSPSQIISSTPYLFHSGLKMIPVTINNKQKTIFGPRLKFVSSEKGFWKKCQLYYKFFKACMILKNLK